VIVKTDILVRSMGPVSERSMVRHHLWKYLTHRQISFRIDKIHCKRKENKEYIYIQNNNIS